MSSWMELSLIVECPHCGDDSSECAEFNNEEGDGGGVTSGVYESFCNSCNKDFWFQARCDFQVEPMYVWAKKPKVKK